MSVQPTGRSLIPKGGLIKKLRVAKALRMLDLAEQSKVSERTIQNLEKGSPVSLVVLRMVAQALEVEVEHLIEKPSLEELERLNTEDKRSRKCSSRVVVEITLSRTFEGFDLTEEACNFINNLKGFVGPTDDFIIRLVDQGSIRFTIEIGKDDLLRLMIRFRERPDIAAKWLGIKEIRTVEAFSLSTNEIDSRSEFRIESDRRQREIGGEGAIEEECKWLRERVAFKDAEIARLRRSIDWMQELIDRLKPIDFGTTDSSDTT